MKKFTKLNEAKVAFDLQDDTIGYIPTKDLKKYLEVANKFLSDEAKNVCQWLIDHNNTYMQELDNGENENVLAGFYMAGVPKNDKYKELYKWIGTLVKKNKFIEIPVFMTKDQFDSIIDGKNSPDEVIMDLDSEAGRSRIAKQYEPLVHKIARSFNGKSNLSYEELLSAGFEGLTWAMNSYGKKSKKQLKKEEETGEEIDISSYKKYTFMSFAAYMIRAAILEDIKNVSQTVRIATSAQAKERKEKGHNTKTNSVSGSAVVGKTKDGGDGKTLFDMISGSEDAGKGIDQEDMDKLWSEVWAILDKEFPAKTMDIWYSSFGVNGHEAVKKKELAKKYGISAGSLSYELAKVNKFIVQNKKLYNKLVDVLELMQECLNERDREDQGGEPYHITIEEKNDD